MKTLSGPTFISQMDLYSSSTVKEMAYGQLGQTSDGRKFRYCRAVATLVTGDCYSSSAQDAQFQTMAVPAAVVKGSTTVTVTNGTTAVTANMFDEGYLCVSYGVGIGQSSRIVSHTTGASGASITYTIEDPLKVALDTTSKVTVVRNPYVDVVIQATTPVAQTAGIAQYAIPTGEYGWIQTGGVAACLWDSSVSSVDTLSVSSSTTTTGAVTVGTGTREVIGNSVQVVPVSAYVAPVFLTLD